MRLVDLHAPTSRQGPGGQRGHAHCSAVTYHWATRAGFRRH